MIYVGFHTPFLSINLFNFGLKNKVTFTFSLGAGKILSANASNAGLA